MTKRQSNGFSEYKQLFLKMDKQLDKAVADISEIKGEIKLLKFKASVWGGVGSGIVITAVALIKHLT